MRWRVVLRVEGPLLMGSGPAAQMVQLGRDFVPGSAWRGALADAVLRHFGAKAPGAAGAKSWPAFEAAFGAGVRFGFLYPGPDPTWDSFPLPLTVYSCKAAPGLAEREAGSGSPGHGLRDMLLVRLRRCAGLGTGRAGRCRCGERLERRRGLAARKAGPDGDGPIYREVKVARRLMVRVGLDRRTETAAEGILYALDAAVPGPDGILCFTGGWWGDRERLEALQDLLEAACPPAGEGRAVRLGTARARGLGKAAVEIRALPGAPLPSLEHRLEAFQPRRPSGEPADPRHLYFSLTLRSPLLVRDRTGAACGRPERALLEPYAENLPADLEFLPEASAVEWETWDGWAMAWGLPRPLVTALAPGSVLAYRAPATEREAVLAFLREVEDRGLGERTAQGWGEAVACDPLHVTFDVDKEVSEGCPARCSSRTS